MSSRLSQFTVSPWTGGLVTSTDQSLIRPDQLTKADNVIFSTQGTRLKREGINSNFDNLSIAVVSRSSSGVIRTLTTTGYKFAVGDQFRISGAGNAAYNTNSAIGTVTSVESSRSSVVTLNNVSSTVTVGSSAAATISMASPAVITAVNTLVAGDKVYFQTTAALPDPILPNTVYYVLTSTPSTFTISTTEGGTPLGTVNAGTGTHTVYMKTDTINWTAQPFDVGDSVYFTSTGTLPSPIVSRQIYYVRSIQTDSFRLSDTRGGTTGSTTTPGTGTLTAYAGAPIINWVANGLNENDPITFTSSGTLPEELVEGQTYFARNVTDDAFQIASSYTGPLTDVSHTGSGTITASEATGDIVSYTFQGANTLNESTTADTGIILSLATRIIAVYDYWWGDTTNKNQATMAFSSAGRLYSIDSSGNRTLIEDGGTPYVIPDGGLTEATLIAFENRLMVAVDGPGNVMKHFFPTDVGGGNTLLDVINRSTDPNQDPATIAATPEPSFLQVHLGRLWANDKSRPDRVHWSEVGVYDQWQGQGTSGALDIEIGDGDPQGVTALFPPFKGVMFISKRTKMYRLDGTTEDNYTVTVVSTGLGCVGHKAVAPVDQDDILFVSDKGVHSISATDAYGDFFQAFVSADIQKSVVETWNRSRMKFIQAAYLPQINTVAFALAEETDQTEQTMWMYNVPLKAWYRWPNVNCNAICLSNGSDKQRFMLGQDNGRVAKTMTNSNFDIAPNGSPKAIVMNISTGLIYPTGNFTNSSGFKRLTLIYRPSGSYTITANFKIDNFSTQPLVYNDSGGNDLLGSTFILNQSVLGIGLVTMPFSQPIDGYGRAFKLNIQQSGVNEFGEILGFAVAYEPTEPVYENRNGDDS